MTTWDALNAKLSYFLSDVPKAGGAYKHKLPLRVDAWNWAQLEFAQHTAREMVVSPLGLEADKRSALLPNDFMEVGQIYDPGKNLIYTPMKFQPGGFRSDASDAPTFWVWGNVLRFETTVARIDLYYYAFWPNVVYKLKDDEQVEIVNGDILVPAWAELPLLHLTAASVLQPLAIESARNREYNTKIDSGTPDDNARRAQAREHLWWYHELLGQHSPQQRLGGIAP